MTSEEEKIYAARQKTKAMNEGYRAAAARLFPGANVNSWSTVRPVEDGAFVEVNVWVPATELEQK